MASTMTFGRSSLSNAPIATCPDCGTVCVYWDEEDLNDDGTLTCWCERNQPCVHGHFMCAYEEGGKCANEESVRPLPTQQPDTR